MELDSVALVIIMVVAIGVSIGIIMSVSSESIGSPGEKIKQVFSDVSNAIMSGKSYDICQDYNTKKISQRDFETLLQAVSRGQCRSNSTTIQLTFSLTKADIANITKSLNLGNKGQNVVYRSDVDSLGIGAVVIKGNPGEHPLKMWDVITLSYEGKPDKDIILKVTQEGCDPYDQNCESMCSYMPDICDPMCYKDQQREDVACDIDCVDANRDGNITGSDRDGICDLDCYGTSMAPSNAYDPDCVWKNKDIFDGICDPNSNGVMDGVCDPDCAMNKTICDPDCNGLESDGNPKGLLSSACYVCDKTCNGFCSMACKMEDNDSDCPNGFQGFNNLTECCGNGKCSNDGGENCQSCPSDCPGAGTTCEDLGKICCPASVLGGDAYGCSQDPKLPENSSCTCSAQCNQNLNLSCNGGHCCQAGWMWSVAENKCINRADVLIVALRANMKQAYSAAQIKLLEDKIEDYRSALSTDGLGSMFIYLDDANTSNLVPGGKYVTSLGSSSDIRATLGPLLKKLNSSYLVIIGGYSRFIQAPVGSSEGSDSVYGDLNGDNFADIAVGRFPDPNGGDLAVIMNAMTTAINLHKSGGIDLTSHISPIMSADCGGPDGGDWSPGKCFCKAVYGSDCQACSSCCGKIGPSALSGKNFVMILAHGPGPDTQDLLYGGGMVQNGPGFLSSLNVKNAFWMTMSCGGGHLRLKQTTGGSIAMTFLKSGGALFVGSTDLNLGGSGNCVTPVGDGCIGSEYAEIARKFKVGVTIGNAYKDGKMAYIKGGYYCDGQEFYTYEINCLYGDPTLKIKSLWPK